MNRCRVCGSVLPWFLSQKDVHIPGTGRPQTTILDCDVLPPFQSVSALRKTHDCDGLQALIMTDWKASAWGGTRHGSDAKDYTIYFKQDKDKIRTGTDKPSLDPGSQRDCWKSIWCGGCRQMMSHHMRRTVISLLIPVWRRLKRSQLSLLISIQEATMWLVLLFFLLSSTKPLPVSFPGGRWKRRRPPAPVQHPRSDLRRQQAGRPGPPTTFDLRLPDVQSTAGNKSSLWGQALCDCRGFGSTRRQQLAVRGRRFF